MIERLTLSTTDGQTLEARWDRADDPSMAVVFCHPHPLQGGSMMAPLMISVTSRLVERGLSVLRFNFRGTGASSGRHDYGTAEQIDITTVVAEAEGEGLPLGLAGWSFGAATSLRWLAHQARSIPWVGIAPPPHGLPVHLPPGPKRIILGEREQVIDPKKLTSYATEQNVDLVMTRGDHFFYGKGKVVGDLVADGLGAAPVA